MYLAADTIQKYIQSFLFNSSFFVKLLSLSSGELTRGGIEAKLRTRLTSTEVVEVILTCYGSQPGQRGTALVQLWLNGDSVPKI